MFSHQPLLPPLPSLSFSSPFTREEGSGVMPIHNLYRCSLECGPIRSLHIIILLYIVSAAQRMPYRLHPDNHTGMIRPAGQNVLTLCSVALLGTKLAKHVYSGCVHDRSTTTDYMTLCHDYITTGTSRI